MSIEIPRDVADREAVPDDLDASQAGNFLIPSPRRRRMAAIAHFAAAAVAAASVALGLPAAMWWVAGFFVVLGGYHLLTAWDLRIRDTAALEIAGGRIGFPIGHVSAELNSVGWRARPVWDVLIYAADEPPGRRAVVRVDAVRSTVLAVFEEELEA